MNTSIYKHDNVTHTCDAAKVVLPILSSHLQIGSIIDIGCGIGTWLKVAKELGINDIVGVDGDYVNRKMLLVEKSVFIAHDLTIKLNLNRRFDLGICLEVAEHLPENAADVLVETITSHTDVIIFSAAVPGQGGQYHLNEQWPDYWEDKFKKVGFIMKDYFRSKIWRNEKVDPWYKQNLFLVIKNDHFLNRIMTPDILPLIHPEVFNAVIVQNQKKETRLRASIKKLENRDVSTLVKRIIKRK